MSLQILFGDDEHTAKDGPYARVLKTRKWLYISSAAATVLALGLYKPSAFNEVFKIIELPARVAEFTIALGLIYMVLLYIFLCWQLIITYDIILGERFSFRREEEISSALDRVDESQRALSEYKDERQKPDIDSLKKAEQYLEDSIDNLQKFERQVGPGAPDDIENLSTSELLKAAAEGSPILSLISARRELRTANDLVTSERAEFSERESEIQKPDPVRLSLQASLARATNTLNALSREDPARRLGYRKVECSIDILRVGLPIFVAVGSWGHLVWKMVRPS